MIRDVESPSILETIVGLPSTLLRLPSATLAALQAIDDISDRLDRLMPLLERIDGGMNTAGTGIDLAALGFSTAASGLEQAVGALNASLPLLSESATVMRAVTERVSTIAFELVTELPKATRSLQDVSPELSAVVGLLEEFVGNVPGVRRVVNVTTTQA